MYTASRVKKHYGGVKALDGVDLQIRSGEVQALLGANGAGKSTLVKILVGAEQPSDGTLTLESEPVQFSDVGDAADHGVAIVSQELNLFPDLSVLHNLFLLREPRRGVLIDNDEMRRRARPVVEAIGLDVPLERRVGELRLGEQQLVEIARALLNHPKILFLDEPTSALQAAETRRLLGVVRTLRDRGVGTVYVSHTLEDVFKISDTITILRNGRVVVARRAAAEMTIPDAVTMMLGEAAHEHRRVKAAHINGAAASVNGAPVNGTPLRLEGVRVERLLEPLDLEAKPGEVVGLAGLDGSGVRTVFDVVFGQRRADSGKITLPNGRAAPSSVTQAVRNGVALVPADRKRLGVMLDKTVFENIATVRGGPLRRMGVILRNGRLIERAKHWGRELGITMSSVRSPVGELSGGNQQKVMFAKWLEADPQVVLLDDPTRGVDVRAKVEMHTIIAQVAAQGRVVLVASSDLEEMSTVCDRVVVFFQGRACGEIRGQDLTERRLLEAINSARL